MNIALVQYNPVWGNRSANRRKIEELLGPVKKGEYDWIIFPEMTLSGFSMDSAKTILDQDDRLFFEDIARKAAAFVTFGGVVDKNNMCITLDPGGRGVASYAKIQLFTPAGEHSHYVPGMEPSSFNVKNIRVSQNICYDLRFANLFWVQAVATDIFVVIANWPASRAVHWKTLVQARAIENQAFVVGVNRVGADPTATYSGDSMVVAPDGEVLLNCGDKEGVFAMKISPQMVQENRRKFPFLRDRKGEVNQP